MEDFPGRLERRLGPLFAYRTRYGGQAAWLGNRFALADRIDRGGTSLVVRAWDRESDTYVAIKLMAPSVFDSRAREEARVLARLSHPGIVGIIAAGSSVLAIDADRIECTYVAMELVSWPTLGDWLRDARPPLASRLRVLLGLAETLQAVHARGLVHRDIKPKNVLVSPTGDSKLIDFGFAVQTATKGDAMTVDVSAIAGTPGYLPPEAVLHRIGPRSDQYQFGVLGIEALTDGRPGRPIPIGVRQTLDEKLGRDVLPIFEKASSFDPEARFRSMDEVVAKLRHVSEPRKVSRRTAILAIAGAAVGAGGVAWWMGGRSSDSQSGDALGGTPTREERSSTCGRIAEPLTLASCVLKADWRSSERSLENTAAEYVLRMGQIDDWCARLNSRLERIGRLSVESGTLEPQPIYRILDQRTTVRAMGDGRHSLLDLHVDFAARDQRRAMRRFLGLVDGTNRLVGLVSGAELEGDEVVQAWVGLVVGAPTEDFSVGVMRALRCVPTVPPPGWTATPQARARLSPSAHIRDVAGIAPMELVRHDARVSTATSRSNVEVLQNVDVLATDDDAVTIYRTATATAIRVGGMMTLLRHATPWTPSSNGWGWLGTVE